MRTKGKNLIQVKAIFTYVPSPGEVGRVLQTNCTDFLVTTSKFVQGYIQEHPWKDAALTDVLPESVESDDYPKTWGKAPIYSVVLAPEHALCQSQLHAYEQRLTAMAQSLMSELKPHIRDLKPRQRVFVRMVTTVLVL